MTTPPNTPTPDYGTLGPGSDIKMGTSTPTFGGGDGRVFSRPGMPAPQTRPQSADAAAKKMTVLSAVIMMFISVGLGAWMFTRANRAANDVRRTGAARQNAQPVDSAAQREAEQLLQHAANNDPAATARITERAAQWRGRIQLTPQLDSLVAAGMNAKDRSTRAATIQLDLAAMNVTEDDASVDRLEAQAESSDHATRIWAIWTLGLLANRGIERERITELLLAHLSDQDVESRHWAVEALACVGSDAVIQPLLKTLRDDPSPMVRERAACSLAESGMLTPEQRRSAIPTLLTYAGDPSLDTATHAWTFHALRDITGQTLPDDATKWREWYQSAR